MNGLGGGRLGLNFVPSNCQPIFMGAQPAYSPWLSNKTIVTACQSEAKSSESAWA